ncbi:LacI family DNA-binding transcriptional regulator [Actinocorallia longicatena]|uniref:LacI family DNA-binding transcriptional regulator n=1 Tax=Actinocorallia longicatena TaxID=111803 RepID=A0ABP6Q6T2_9ACTN
MSETPAPRAASIWDVAKVAGVSHQTVSRVVNNRGRVSAETRVKVMAAIEELGYRPNRAAAALAGGRPRSVTVLTSDTSLYGAAATLKGIEEAARNAGYNVGISVLDPDAAQTEHDVLGRLATPEEAVIVIAFDAPGVRALKALPAGHPSAAAIEYPGASDDPPPASHVWLDDRAAAYRATRYLLDLGHHTVHYLAIPSSSGTSQRAKGWQDALEDRAVPAPTDAGWSPRSAYLAARPLVADPDVTAILCGNDDLALGVLRAAHERGRSVPGDLSVAGFDDAPASAFLHPSLTTVRLDFEGLGKGAFGQLQRILEPDAPLTPPWAEPELLVRESTGPRRPAHPRE